MVVRGIHCRRGWIVLQRDSGRDSVVGNRGSWWNSGWSRNQRVEWKWDMVLLEEGPVKQCGVHVGWPLGT